MSKHGPVSCYLKKLWPLLTLGIKEEEDMNSTFQNMSHKPLGIGRGTHIPWNGCPRWWLHFYNGPSCTRVCSFQKKPLFAIYPENRKGNDKRMLLSRAPKVAIQCTLIWENLELSMVHLPFESMSIGSCCRSISQKVIAFTQAIALNTLSLSKGIIWVKKKKAHHSQDHVLHFQWSISLFNVSD